MKEVKIKVSNISNRQWVNLLLELNLVKDAWRRFGPELNIRATNLDKIIRWGRKKHDEDSGDPGSTVQRKSSKRKNRIPSPY